MTFTATEWIGVSQRSWGPCVIQLCAALGQCVLAGLVYFIRNWRLTQLVTAALHAVIAIYIWCGFVFSYMIIGLCHPECKSRIAKRCCSLVSRCILESARWLLGRGKTGEAKRLISKVATINNYTIPEGLLEKVTYSLAVVVFHHTGSFLIRVLTQKTKITLQPFLYPRPLFSPGVQVSFVKSG